jgi:hypothetical protein
VERATGAVMEVLWYAVRARCCAKAALVSTHYRPDSLPDSQAEFEMKVKLTLDPECVVTEYLEHRRGQWLPNLGKGSGALKAVTVGPDPISRSTSRRTVYGRLDRPARNERAALEQRIGDSGTQKGVRTRELLS